MWSINGYIITKSVLWKTQQAQHVNQPKTRRCHPVFFLFQPMPWWTWIVEVAPRPSKHNWVRLVHTRRRFVLVSSCELAMVVVAAEESGKREFGGMARGRREGRDGGRLYCWLACTLCLLIENERPQQHQCIRLSFFNSLAKDKPSEVQLDATKSLVKLQCSPLGCSLYFTLVHFHILLRFRSWSLSL